RPGEIDAGRARRRGHRGGGQHGRHADQPAASRARCRPRGPLRHQIPRGTRRRPRRGRGRPGGPGRKDLPLPGDQRRHAPPDGRLPAAAGDENPPSAGAAPERERHGRGALSGGPPQGDGRQLPGSRNAPAPRGRRLPDERVRGDAQLRPGRGLRGGSQVHPRHAAGPCRRQPGSGRDDHRRPGDLQPRGGVEGRPGGARHTRRAHPLLGGHRRRRRPDRRSGTGPGCDLMPRLSVLTERTLRSLVGMGEEELGAIEAVYPLISRGEAVMPPIMRIDAEAHNGEIDVKSAYLPGYDSIAIKVSAGFFDNPALGLPSLGGFMMVLDSRTGIPSAALFDNGYLTDLRTGLAGAVAARHLAPEGPVRAAVIGAGVQARYQLRALRLVREVTAVTVWARRPEQAKALAEELGGEVAGSVREAVAAADVVVTATPATEGLVSADDLHPGLHVTAVGSDA